MSCSVPTRKNKLEKTRLDSRHYFRMLNFLKNRDQGYYETPLDSYRKEVSSWALKSEARFWNLCWQLQSVVANPRFLNEAWKLTKHKPLETFKDPPDYWAYLRKLGDAIGKNYFSKGKYRQVSIPKRGKAGNRIIEVPCFPTRVVAKAVYLVLSPIFDPSFYPLSIGSRPGKSRWDGLAASEIYAGEGFVHWVTVDIRDAFGQLPKARCFQILEKRLKHSSILDLLQELSDRGRKKGFPQGVSTSGLVMNVYLDHNFDHWFVRNFPDARMIRYVDDIAIFCRTETQAKTCYEAVKKRITSIGLQLKESWEQAYTHLKIGKSVEWLGLEVKRIRGKFRFGISEKLWDEFWVGLKRAPEALKDFDRYQIEEEMHQAANGWFGECAIGILNGKELIQAKEKILEFGKANGADMTDFVLTMQDIWQNRNHDFQLVKAKMKEVTKNLDEAKEKFLKKRKGAKSLLFKDKNYHKNNRNFSEDVDRFSELKNSTDHDDDRSKNKKTESGIPKNIELVDRVQKRDLVKSIIREDPSLAKREQKLIELFDEIDVSKIGGHAGRALKSFEEVPKGKADHEFPPGK